MKRITSITRFTVLLSLIFLVVPQLSSALGVKRIQLQGVQRITSEETAELKPPSLAKDLQTNLFYSPQEQPSETTEPGKEAVSGTVAESGFYVEQEEAVDCQFDMPTKPEYSGFFISVRKKGVVASGEAVETKVYIKNTGNVPWFSSDSGCPYMITNLGTDFERDRESIFFTDDLLWESGWQAPNRISMSTKKVNPGELAVFKFWSRAPQETGWYREYFTPVIEGVTWLDEARFFTDYRVGDATIDLTKKGLLKYIERSADLTKVDLNGEKSINVSISNQRMKLKIGEIVIRDFPVSTGTTRTPTPLGTTHISLKQEVRVAGSWPHYIMPKWQTFRGGGYGLHALPSLANDRGRFWTEALNHIGTRRSHGCIRLLPNDANYVYDFTDIGTTVNVTW